MSHLSPFSRRDFLRRAGMGIGSLAFLDLLNREARAKEKYDEARRRLLGIDD